MLSFVEQEFYHEDIVKTEILLTPPPASDKYSPPQIIKAISQEQVNSVLARNLKMEIFNKKTFVNSTK